MIEIDVDVLQNKGFIVEIEKADCAAEHVKARMILVTEQNVTREKVGRVFESLVFLPFVRIHDTPIGKRRGRPT